MPRSSKPRTAALTLGRNGWRRWWWLLPIAMWLGLQPPSPARGKAGAGPDYEATGHAEQAAQALALADPRVIERTAGQWSEVFGIQAVGAQYTPASAICATTPCLQVSIYNFTTNSTVVAIVDVERDRVLDVLEQPGVHPAINRRIHDLAVRLIRSDPEVVAELGYRPAAANIHPMEAGIPGSACEAGHLCLAATFNQGASLLWAIVDITDNRVVGVTRTRVATEAAGEAAPAEAQVCPAAGALERAGWSVAYETTPSDGFRVYDAAFQGMPVLASAKLLEWHVDYGSSGFVDATGCASGPGSYILPYGETQVLDIVDGEGQVIGFELVQDFRMDMWGLNCNYRYEQHFQFYADGRFRMVGGAYGRGCGTNAVYRPILRLDLAIAGQAADTFAIWDGQAWQAQAEEGWWTQAAPYTAQGLKWRVTDVLGRGYALEPGQGQFGDGGRGDNAYVYVTRHQAAEGDTDMGNIGGCCRDDHEQGPERFINSESIAGADLVLWYVPQMMTEAPDGGAPGEYYCWTVQGEPNPETYPCFAGPMFWPIAEPPPYAYRFPAIYK